MKTVSITLPDPVYDTLMSSARARHLSPDEVVVQAIRAFGIQAVDRPVSFFDLPPLDLGTMFPVEDDDLLGRCWMIHGLDTSYLVAMEVTGHPQYAAAQARLLPLLWTSPRMVDTKLRVSTLPGRSIHAPNATHLHRRVPD